MSLNSNDYLSQKMLRIRFYSILGMTVSIGFIGSRMADNEESFAQLQSIPMWQLIPPHLW
ncbi:Hypothetical predicted protein [Mytilus galloprovincialis]|uniref:Uncharacterized protein n=1 Tax=Mytilus galloprovincialis TaxID=29158 RepID=A0A8B6F0A1_MYTGA|nr:Hypothetical predicted protein [Mytilus galloprovincialis]